MRHSLKTRLLSAAYRAACALAEQVFSFTERLRERKDDSYLDDLYDHRDALAEELREGTALLGALERRLDNVQAELEITNREIYGPSYLKDEFRHSGTVTGRFTSSTPNFEEAPLPQALADFDDLPAPQGVDENDAPEGYKAVVVGGGCTGCAFDPVGTCPGPACFSNQRGDGQEVVFQRR